MIITEFLEGQGLGNQLWTYSTSRSIANYLKTDFIVLGYEKFKAKDFLEISCGHSRFSHLAFDEFYEIKYHDLELNYIASGFDERVKLITKNTKLNGLFQSEKYFFNNLSQINDFIKLHPHDTSNFTFDFNNTCILNIRGGEYKLHKQFILPKSYWLDAISNMKSIYGVEKFLIVTDDYNYARYLFPNLQILSGSIKNCFLALFYAKFVIVSNSTFSYFPIKLSSNKKIVIAPKFWARFNNSLDRWISPANIYSDWYWQDKDGILSTYEDNIELAEKTENYYLNNYSLLTHESNLQRRQIFSSKFKRPIKKVLSYFFPQHF